MSFDTIPEEMRKFDQWVVWRLEIREGSEKPTKVPYEPRPNAGKADVNNPKTWGTYLGACLAPMTCKEPVPAETPISETGYSGIGFVLSKNDPYCFIDLDNTYGDLEAYERQLKIFNEFNSFSELSPSGTGLHIIIKGSVPHGRRRAAIEVYSDQRYMTMTGNVHFQAPIAKRQKLLDVLFEQLGGAPKTFAYGESKAEKDTDDVIVGRASQAVNGEKFTSLYKGEWQGLYSSQSEADFALIDIIAFYTQNAPQIARIFRSSNLGVREKAKRDDYVGYMVNKSFDRQLPEVDIDGLRIQWERDNSKHENGAIGEPGGTPIAPSEPGGIERQPVANPALHNTGAAVKMFPPGLLGDVAHFILDAAPRPVPQIALATAIALLSGICGRAYNISGAGLNQYILSLADTGTGKDIVSSGIAKIMSEVIKSTPAASDFRGPGELVSSAGLIKWLNEKPASLSILGEFGAKLKEMASPHANSHLTGLERVLLQLYSKSGNGNVLDPMAYSDVQKNTKLLHAPSLTIIGESVPERFYDQLDDDMVASGLLPRFMIFEYTGKRSYLKEGTQDILPPFELVQAVSNLCANCLTIAHNNNVHNVPMDQETTEYFRGFDKWSTDQINETNTEITKQLWNRAHIKALKLAAVVSIGINYTQPIVTIEAATWATDMIVEQTRRLITKFERGLIGASNSAEGKQLREVIEVIATYMNEDFSRFEKYGGTRDMHRDGVIIAAHISRRCVARAAFRNDRQGATNAVKRALTLMLEADEIREIAKPQMQAKYGSGPKAYVISNPARFVLEKD